MFSHHTGVFNMACAVNLQLTVGETKQNEMTNRTEEEGRPKDSTLCSYFSTCAGLQSLGARAFFGRKLCFGTFLS